MKLFEAIVDGKNMTWLANDKTKLSKKANKVTVTQQHETYGEIHTVFDLDKLVYYTVG